MLPLGFGGGSPLGRLLAIGAHSDDLEIGCGGTVLALTRANPGLAVHWVVLAAHGEPRRESDTPEEHLARVLGRLDVDRRATRRLVDLFVRAEFSPHVVDAAMKDEAIDALVRVRDELRDSAGLAEPAEVPA